MALEMPLDADSLGMSEGQMKKKKKNILCLNTMQLSIYPPNKTIFSGTESVEASL